MILTLGEKKADLAKAFPLTLGDWKGFKAIGLVDDKGQMSASMDPVVVGQMLEIMLKKAYLDITISDIDLLPMTRISLLVTSICCR